MIMRRFYYILLLLLMFVSCSKEDFSENLTEYESEPIEVSFQVGSNSNNSKVWYDKNEEQPANTLFDAKWNIGDSVTIIVNNKNHSQQSAFYVTEAGNRNIISGIIQKWGNPCNLYSIYPHRDDIYSREGNKFKYNISTQVINAKISDEHSHESTANSMKNSILLAEAKEVTWKNNLPNIERLYYRQVMSFLRFTLKETTKKHEIVRITLKDVDKSFVTEAQFWLKGDQVEYNKLSTSNQVSAIIEAQDKTGKAMVNFALFPTELTNATIEIETIDKSNNTYIFHKPLGKMLFERNTFNYYSDELGLISEDFENTSVEESIELESFKHGGNVPSGDEWIIKTPETINSEDLNDLQEVLGRADKNISLKFINVKKMEDEVFYDFKKLESIELPQCEEIGNQTFVGCTNLRKVVMPALKKAGEYTFSNQKETSPQIQFIVATDPGVKLEYSRDGVFTGIYNGNETDGFVNERVHITLGNKYLYDSSEYGDNFLFIGHKDGDNQYFGSITWQ